MSESCRNCGGLYATEDMELIAGTPCKCGARPCCPDWFENIDKLNAPIALQSVRSGGQYQYDGKKFIFCPWCAKRLSK